MDIGESFQSATDGFFAFLPNLLGFLVILIIGFIIAKVVSAVVRKVLEKAGLDRHLHSLDANKYVEKVMPGASPANGIARVVFWLIFIFFLFSAVGALKIPALTAFMNEVLAYIPNIIAALIIFVIAAVVAGAAGGAAAKVMGDTPTGKIVGTVVPALVMVIAVFMILSQLQIAPDIVQIAFAATMAALALGLALAFGLGGRPVAERMLGDAYRKGQEQKDQVKHDAQLARDRGQEQAQRGKDRAQREVEGGERSSGDGGRHGATGTYWAN